MVKRITTEDFVKKAIGVHGRKYDYSQTEYLTTHTKVKIICPRHGIFQQTPANHLFGQGCVYCKGKKKNTDDFIQQAHAVHNGKYDYSQTEYVGATTKLKIICPEHGEFWTTPQSHLMEYGCSVCAKRKRLKKATGEFIQQANSVHNGKYDYSQAKYAGAHTKLKIVCPTHGEFWKYPGDHISGQGCQKCARQDLSMRFRKSKESFTQEAITVHGDRYDYSRVVYINQKHKVEIICPTHGVFNQNPSMHIQGKGCPICGGKIKKTLEEFIEQSRKINGDKYDYSQTDYVNSHTKVKIICSIHGEFWQSPTDHLHDKSGCPKCTGRYRTTDEFIEQSKQIHGDKYDYSQTDYVNSYTKLKIVCPIHGEFWQSPTGHIKGRGCSKCGGTDKKTTEEFIQQARQIHGDLYDYSRVVYLDVKQKVEIVCSVHGSFLKTPDDHINGKTGCGKCSTYGFKTDKHGSIYLIKFKSDIASFWKVGITNRTIKERFPRDHKLIQSGLFWNGCGHSVYQAERDLLDQYDNYKLKYLFPLLEDGGDTECFTLDLPVKEVVKTITQKLKSPPEIFQGA